MSKYLRYYTLSDGIWDIKILSKAKAREVVPEWIDSFDSFTPYEIIKVHKTGIHLSSPPNVGDLGAIANWAIRELTAPINASQYACKDSKKELEVEKWQKEEL